MLAIKLQRIGKKHQPTYRLVVAEKRSKMAAPPVEDLGSYNPATKASTFNKERAAYWVKIGAQPTPTAHNLLIKEGALSGARVRIKMKKPVAAPAAETVVAATPATEAAAPAEAAASEAPAVE